MIMSNENLYLYILMRTDLPSLSTGRAAAQASHASNAFIHKFGGREDVIRWQAQTPQGFGTAIVLSAGFRDITETIRECHGAGFGVCDTVIDPDYVVPISSELVTFLNTDDTRFEVETSATDPNKSFIHRSEVTCAYVFGDKERLAPILSRFPLYS
jgi:hypothetical protein